ncbi:carboxypeptidase-like regulatory domain-containing protein [Cytophagaceae bacterium ABcell3]|nr:carboxypeptidase-like regulatory domain-containing protein [Cytophagaceae bacterium ABcell3]
MKKLYILFFTLCSAISFAQENYTVSGIVKDGELDFELSGAGVYIQEIKKGTYANEGGFYKVVLPPGTYTFRVTSFGYDTLWQKVNVDKDLNLDFTLQGEDFMLEEVEVAGERTNNNNITSTEMSTVEMDMAEIQSVPVLFGETDVIRTLTLMPGVQTTGDGFTGLFVRGGGTDQNLILVDDAVVYNPFHLLGFFSAFNGDAVRDLKLYKAGVPSLYGGRLSSVLDVRMRSGNKERFSGNGGIGLISSRLTLEGPFAQDKGSFIISGRRTYADLFLNLSPNESLRNSTLHFYDLNFKADYTLSDKDRVSLSGYYGRDVFGYSDNFRMGWGNATSSLRWSHIYNSKLHHTTTLSVSNYDYNINFNLGDFGIELNSGIRTYNAKTDWDWQPNKKHHVRFGFSTMYHDFRMPSFSSNIEGLEEAAVPSRNALEHGVYIQNDHVISPRLTLSYGIRLSMFNLIGPSEVYGFDEGRRNVTDTSFYNRGEVYHTYLGPEPRLSATYIIDPENSIKVSYNRMRQHLHLLSNSSAAFPLDLWVPVSNVISPQIGDQVSAGYFRNFKENMYETSVEVYYKDMQNQIDYRSGANLFFNPIVETELLFGRGWAYGAEFLVKKRKGRLNGWISYTLSRSLRLIEGINEGNPYPSNFERIHDISVVGNYQINNKWQFSGSWVYATGTPVTFPAGRYTYEGRTVNFYTGRNEYRMPSYHRMDVSFTYQRPREGRFNSSWNFSVYNLYARHNPFLIDFRENEQTGEMEAVQVALFRIIPSVTWNFNF